MKKNIILLLLIAVSGVTFAQRASGFPTKIASTAIDFDRVTKEAINGDITFLNASVTAPVSGSQGINGFDNSIAVTEYFLATGYDMEVSGGKAVANIQWYSGANNTSVGESNHRKALNNSSISVSFPFPRLIMPRTSATMSLTSGDGTTPLSATGTISGFRITADMNYNASKVILWIGDSVVRGTSLDGNSYSNYTDVSAITPNDHFAFKVRNALNAAGKDTRLVLKAMGSYTSRMLDLQLRMGWMDIPQADLICWQAGINDATGSTTDQQFTDCIDNLIAWRNNQFPNKPILLIGPTPLNNGTHEARLAQLRALMASKANSGSKIYYVSIANVFSPATLSNYASNDGVHPNTANQGVMATPISSYILSNITF